MRFNLLSSFAAGVLIATAICGGVYFSSDHGSSKKTDKTVESKTQTAAQPSESEMKNKLASAGYVVQTKAEYDKHIADAKTASQKSASSNDKSNKVIYRVVFKVTDGMTSIDVGKLLVKAKIIDDAFKFSKDVENKGIENNLRPGTYEVDSEMSYNQVISTIFKP
ncbi:aminodeoxychorismate lyase [Heyndrickxia ginsengihumi]|uniref:Aminodeoxychorismate lyase n=1 Tax=Heyndrickxia ginsengihumi TaxID=363870 RepID=A0A0A6Y1B9_9BACI|nr:aminodeoxychorismate lyase [Heyndrickxia ginsengihumi]KHD86097.1 aminodeoxychorismate lyase [Heyndrickxia ginsengihumi]MCM3023408.1 endolytic transglycosylase MltG [Heyndrickxia ginsengihumi]NEY21345.1 endolytic transglycosylase MltG [Heyndrickxia ginsengihumi]